MRKLIVCNIVSLDGYVSGPDDDVMVMPFDRGFSEYNAERLRGADTVLLGRKSFEGFRSYWPTIADDPDAEPVEREISRLNNAIERIVVSDSLPEKPGRTLERHPDRPKGRSTSRRGRTESKWRQGHIDLWQPHTLE